MGETDSGPNGVEAGFGSYVGVALLLGAALLPAFSWFFYGHRAMSGLETATSMTWERRHNPDGGFDSDMLSERLALAQQHAATQAVRWTVAA